jgi:hypothetical protein
MRSVKENNSPFSSTIIIFENTSGKINPNPSIWNLLTKFLFISTIYRIFTVINFNNLINEVIDQAKISQMISTTPKNGKHIRNSIDDNFNTYLSRFARKTVWPLSHW